MLVKWKDKRWCSIFLITRQDDDDYIYGSTFDGCKEGFAAALAFVEGILFLVTAYCLYVFVYYRFDKAIRKDSEVQHQEQVQVVPSVEKATVTSSVSPQEQNHLPNDGANDKVWNIYLKETT